MGSEKLTELFLSVKRSIRNEFPKERNATETLALYLQLVDDGGIIALVNIVSAFSWWWWNISFFLREFWC